MLHMTEFRSRKIRTDLYWVRGTVKSVADFSSVKSRLMF